MTTVTPKKPWRPKAKDLLPEIFGALFTTFSTLAVVALTPLKGKLGFSIALIVMAIITSASISWLRKDRKAAFNSVSTVFVYVAAAFVIIPLASLLFEIIRKGAPGLSLGIFTKDMSLAAADSPLNEGGLLHAVIGTLYVVLLATIISTPIGFLTSLYIVEVKGRFASTVRFFVQAMSGVPSIVAGLFIYAVWMIGLGNSYNSTQWRTVAMIILPAAKSGLVTSMILGIARVAGETAPLLLTIGGADATNLNPFEGNNSALPYYVWKNYSLGNPESIQRAWLGVIVLMMMVFIFFSLARYFGRTKGARR